ncbi:hypothetical protein ACHAQH_005363 [Verticillium albo-atrum]
MPVETSEWVASDTSRDFGVQFDGRTFQEYRWTFGKAVDFTQVSPELATATGTWDKYQSIAVSDVTPEAAFIHKDFIREEDHSENTEDREANHCFPGFDDLVHAGDTQSNPDSEPANESG